MQKLIEAGEEVPEELRMNHAKKFGQMMDDEDTEEDDVSDYSSEEKEHVAADELDYEGIAAILKDQRYEDDSRINYHDYVYCVHRDADSIPDPKKVREVAIRKTHFILMEIINDMGIKKGDCCDTLITLIQAFVVVQVRMAIHYLTQYLFLKLADAPVLSVEPKWYKIKLEYAYWNFETQLLVIIAGTLGNTFLFCFLILICYLS